MADNDERWCEFERGNRTLCGDTAYWLVGVGTRVTDRQRACAVHLEETCLAIYEAEGRGGATLTVSALR